MPERTGATEKRLALAERVAALRNDGWTHRAIADELGISRSYAADLDLDPDGSKGRARKDSYRLPCPECGRLMSGSDGRDVAPERCAECARADPPRYWNRETILAAFHKFCEQTGRVPTATDLQGLAPSIAVRLSETRLREIQEAKRIRLPHTSVVMRFFGSWKAALEAAGYGPNPTGGAAHRGTSRRVVLGPTQRLVLAALQDGEATRRELSARLGREVHGKPTVQRLIERGLVERRRVGRAYTYRLADASRYEEESMADNVWVVLKPTKQNGTTITLDEIARIGAPTRDIACERAADVAGSYIVVRERDWEPLTVAPVERLAVVRA